METRNFFVLEDLGIDSEDYENIDLSIFDGEDFDEFMGHIFGFALGAAFDEEVDGERIGEQGQRPTEEAMDLFAKLPHHKKLLWLRFTIDSFLGDA